MASSAKLQAEPINNYYFPSRCPACQGQGKILYPFPGNRFDQPLGGVKIKSVTCLKCDGSGEKDLSF
jgi:DnaJ-class molecular chaperone